MSDHKPPIGLFTPEDFQRALAQLERHPKTLSQLAAEGVAAQEDAEVMRRLEIDPAWTEAAKQPHENFLSVLAAVALEDPYWSDTEAGDGREGAAGAGFHSAYVLPVLGFAIKAGADLSLIEGAGDRDPKQIAEFNRTVNSGVARVKAEGYPIGHGATLSIKKLRPRSHTYRAALDAAYEQLSYTSEGFAKLEGGWRTFCSVRGGDPATTEELTRWAARWAGMAVGATDPGIRAAARAYGLVALTATKIKDQTLQEARLGLTLWWTSLKPSCEPHELYEAALERMTTCLAEGVFRGYGVADWNLFVRLHTEAGFLGRRVDPQKLGNLPTPDRICVALATARDAEASPARVMSLLRALRDPNWARAAPNATKFGVPGLDLAALECSNGMWAAWVRAGIETPHGPVRQWLLFSQVFEELSRGALSESQLAAAERAQELFRGPLGPHWTGTKPLHEMEMRRDLQALRKVAPETFASATYYLERLVGEWTRGARTLEELVGIESTPQPQLDVDKRGRELRLAAAAAALCDPKWCEDRTPPAQEETLRKPAPTALRDLGVALRGGETRFRQLGYPPHTSLIRSFIKRGYRPRSPNYLATLDPGAADRPENFNAEGFQKLERDWQAFCFGYRDERDSDLLFEWAPRWAAMAAGGENPSIRAAARARGLVAYTALGVEGAEARTGRLATGAVFLGVVSGSENPKLNYEQALVRVLLALEEFCPGPELAWEPSLFRALMKEASLWAQSLSPEERGKLPAPGQLSRLEGEVQQLPKNKAAQRRARAALGAMMDPKWREDTRAVLEGRQNAFKHGAPSFKRDSAERVSEALWGAWVAAQRAATGALHDQLLEAARPWLLFSQVFEEVAQDTSDESLTAGLDRANRLARGPLGPWWNPLQPATPEEVELARKELHEVAPKTSSKSFMHLERKAAALHGAAAAPAGGTENATPRPVATPPGSPLDAAVERLLTTVPGVTPRRAAMARGTLEDSGWWGRARDEALGVLGPACKKGSTTEEQISRCGETVADLAWASWVRAQAEREAWGSAAGGVRPWKLCYEAVEDARLGDPVDRKQRLGAVADLFSGPLGPGWGRSREVSYEKAEIALRRLYQASPATYRAAADYIKERVTEWTAGWSEEDRRKLVAGFIPAALGAPTASTSAATAAGNDPVTKKEETPAEGPGAARFTSTSGYVVHLDPKFLELPKSAEERKEYFRKTYENDPFKAVAEGTAPATPAAAAATPTPNSNGDVFPEGLLKLSEQAYRENLIALAQEFGLWDKVAPGDRFRFLNEWSRMWRQAAVQSENVASVTFAWVMEALCQTALREGGAVSEEAWQTLALSRLALCLPVTSTPSDRPRSYQDLVRLIAAVADAAMEGELAAEALLGHLTNFAGYAMQKMSAEERQGLVEPSVLQGLCGRIRGRAPGDGASQRAARARIAEEAYRLIATGSWKGAVGAAVARAYEGGAHPEAAQRAVEAAVLISSLSSRELGKGELVRWMLFKAAFDEVAARPDMDNFARLARVYQTPAGPNSTEENWEEFSLGVKLWGIAAPHSLARAGAAEHFLAAVQEAPPEHASAVREVISRCLAHAQKGVRDALEKAGKADPDMMTPDRSKEGSVAISPPRGETEVEAFADMAKRFDLGCALLYQERAAPRPDRNQERAESLRRWESSWMSFSFNLTDPRLKNRAELMGVLCGHAAALLGAGGWGESGAKDTLRFRTIILQDFPANHTPYEDGLKILAQLSKQIRLDPVTGGRDFISQVAQHVLGAGRHLTPEEAERLPHRHTVEGLFMGSWSWEDEIQCRLSDGIRGLTSGSEILKFVRAGRFLACAEGGIHDFARVGRWVLFESVVEEVVERGGTAEDFRVLSAIYRGPLGPRAGGGGEDWEQFLEDLRSCAALAPKALSRYGGHLEETAHRAPEPTREAFYTILRENRGRLPGNGRGEAPAKVSEPGAAPAPEPEAAAAAPARSLRKKLTQEFTADAGEVALRVAVEAARAELAARLVAWSAVRIGATSSAARAQQAAFFSSPAGQGLTSYLLGLGWKAARGHASWVPGGELGDRIAREIRLQGGEEIAAGFYREVVTPLLSSLSGAAPELGAGTTRLRFEAPCTVAVAVPAPGHELEEPADGAAEATKQGRP